MGLDISTSDGVMNFHIGYFGFNVMRSFFILHYSQEAFDDYRYILKHILKINTLEIDKIYDRILSKIGGLQILVDHSDADGELTSEECKELRPWLRVDKDKILSISTNESKEYDMRIIYRMYEFIDLIQYGADHEGVKLIFG